MAAPYYPKTLPDSGRKVNVELAVAGRAMGLFGPTTTVKSAASPNAVRRVSALLLGPASDTRAKCNFPRRTPRAVERGPNATSVWTGFGPRRTPPLQRTRRNALRPTSSLEDPTQEPIFGIGLPESLPESLPEPLPEPEMFVDVAIAGAGLGGLALAIGLQERGFNSPRSVMLFEAFPRFRSETGTTLSVFQNGAKALDGIKPGLSDAVANCAIRNTKTTFISRLKETSSATAEAATTATSVPGAAGGGGINDGWIVRERTSDMLTVGWARVQKLLFQTVLQPETNILHGHRIVAYRPVFAKIADSGAVGGAGSDAGSNPDSGTVGESRSGSAEGEVEAVDVVVEVVGSNPVTDKSEHGAASLPQQQQQKKRLMVVRAKVLVAADGVRSAVRNQMIGDEPRYLNQFGWNALVPNPPGAGVYPQEEGVTVLRDDVTGNQIFLTDAGHGEAFWQVSAADPDGSLGEELKLTPFGGFGKPGVKDRVLRHVTTHLSDHDIWQTILQAVTSTDPCNIYERWIMDRVPPKDSWSDPKCGNRVVLMGDAAHAMHPGLGQGAQTTFEDAHQLSLCLADIRPALSEPAAVAAAVREYEARRIGRCVKVHAHATAMHGFGEEGRVHKALSMAERMKKMEEFGKWVMAYSDNVHGDFESTYFK